MLRFRAQQHHVRSLARLHGTIYTGTHALMLFSRFRPPHSQPSYTMADVIAPALGFKICENPDCHPPIYGTSMFASWQCLQMYNINTHCQKCNGLLTIFRPRTAHTETTDSAQDDNEESSEDDCSPAQDSVENEGRENQGNEETTSSNDNTTSVQDENAESMEHATSLPAEESGNDGAKSTP